MVTAVWVGIHVGAALLWFLGERLLGMHDHDESMAITITWLVLPPITAIGAMVHERRVRGTSPYGYAAAVRQGLSTLASTTVAILAFWALILHGLMPDYFEMLHRAAEQAGLAAGNVQLAQQRRAISMALLSEPGFYLWTAGAAAISGTIAVLVAALGVRQRRTPPTAAA